MVGCGRGSADDDESVGSNPRARSQDGGRSRRPRRYRRAIDEHQVDLQTFSGPAAARGQVGASVSGHDAHSHRSNAR